MKANYHTHTFRCRHAYGSEREYVENAIAGGIKTLGFSDHAPYLFSTGYYSDMRMRPEETEGYVDTVLALKKEYAADIDIRLGLEMEYYPAHFVKTVEFLSQYPFEYAILGQHALGNEAGEHWTGTPTADGHLMRRYANQVIEALYVGKWLYIAHPDIMNFTGSAEEYEAQMERVCLAAKEHGVPLECNLLGLWSGRNYPNRAFWKIAGKVGNRTVLGCDAHTPDKVCQPAEEARACGLLMECGCAFPEDGLDLGADKTFGLR